MYSLLLYDYVDDIVERRAPFRDAHLALVRDLDRAVHVEILEHICLPHAISFDQVRPAAG